MVEKLTLESLLKRVSNPKDEDALFMAKALCLISLYSNKSIRDTFDGILEESKANFIL